MSSSDDSDMDANRYQAEPLPARSQKIFDEHVAYVNWLAGPMDFTNMPQTMPSQSLRLLNRFSNASERSLQNALGAFCENQPDNIAWHACVSMLNAELERHTAITQERRWAVIAAVLEVSGGVPTLAPKLTAVCQHIANQICVACV